MSLLLCEKCGTGVDAPYGKDLYCALCGHLTKDAEYKGKNILLQISASKLSEHNDLTK